MLTTTSPPGVEEVAELRVVVGPGAEEPREYSSKLSRP
jgi:hypothetical protein